MSYIFIANSVLFAFLNVIWSKSNWLNIFIKLMFLGMLVANGICAYQTWTGVLK